ncbi:thiamine diphosphokinase [Bacillota bacterium]
MGALLMANGEYGAMEWYEKKMGEFDVVFCTDGAAAKAGVLGVIPDVLVGDMDSILEKDLLDMKKKQVEIYQFPAEKDCTDTFLALELMRDKGIKDVTVWGGTGGRLDHTMANVFACISFVREGMSIVFSEAGLNISIVGNELKIAGDPGDTVSIFPLGEERAQVSLSGFKYPLEKSLLKQEFPIGISNVLNSCEGRVFTESGMLAVFHYINGDC